MKFSSSTVEPVQNNDVRWDRGVSIELERLLN